jgi:hypothetical protein
MLDDELREKHRNSYVVRFDPWLVSGRNDLINAFFAELTATIASHSDNEAAVVGETISAIAKYAGKLAPLIKILDPSGVSSDAIGASSAAVADAVGRTEQLSKVRDKLIEKVEALKAPIIVLIDEIDRIEDAEIRAIAQLVRSVLDFPGVSYLLAYDQSRVVQALGTGATRIEQLERGRAYLEKIVQLPIALPILLPDERHHLFASELKRLEMKGLPQNFNRHARFSQLAGIVCERLVANPRDIKRVVGVFHVLRGMVGSEVDWVDMLGFSVLQARFPMTVELIRNNIDRYVDNPASEAESLRRMIRKEKPEDPFTGLVAPEDDSPDLRRLLEFLFQVFGKERSRDHVDPISFRRCLLTVARLGLTDSVVSRAELQKILQANRRKVRNAFDRLKSKQQLSSFVERLDNAYADPDLKVPVSFWRGASDFLSRPQNPKAKDLIFRRDTSDEFAAVLLANVRREARLRPHAREVFEALAADSDLTLVPDWLRRHVTALGRGEPLPWLDEAAVLHWTKTLAAEWKAQLIAGSLLTRLTDFQPIYLVLDSDWDDATRAAMTAAVDNNEVFDALVVLIYGGHHSAGRALMDRIFGDGVFRSKAAARITEAPTDDILLASLGKATDETWD